MRNPGRSATTEAAEHVGRLKRRFVTKGETKAIFSVGQTMIVIVWNILASNDASYY